MKSKPKRNAFKVPQTRTAACQVISEFTCDVRSIAGQMLEVECLMLAGNSVVVATLNGSGGRQRYLAQFIMSEAIQLVREGLGFSLATYVAVGRTTGPKVVTTFTECESLPAVREAIGRLAVVFRHFYYQQAPSVSWSEYADLLEAALV